MYVRDTQIIFDISMRLTFLHMSRTSSTMGLVQEYSNCCAFKFLKTNKCGGFSWDALRSYKQFKRIERNYEKQLIFC